MVNLELWGLNIVNWWIFRQITLNLKMDTIRFNPVCFQRYGFSLVCLVSKKVSIVCSASLQNESNHLGKTQDQVPYTDSRTSRPGVVCTALVTSKDFFEYMIFSSGTVMFFWRYFCIHTLSKWPLNVMSHLELNWLTWVLIKIMFEVLYLVIVVYFLLKLCEWCFSDGCAWR